MNWEEIGGKGGQVLDIVQASDPFDGPDFAELRPLLVRINSGR